MLRKLFCGALFASVVLPGMPALAQAPAYPSKPIRIVVPFGPGSATDNISRMAAEKAGKSLGTTFVIDNKPGANGLIAAREVVGAPKDGYTIIVSSNLPGGCHAACASRTASRSGCCAACSIATCHGRWLKGRRWASAFRWPNGCAVRCAPGPRICSILLGSAAAF